MRRLLCSIPLMLAVACGNSSTTNTTGNTTEEVLGGDSGEGNLGDGGGTLADGAPVGDGTTIGDGTPLGDGTAATDAAPTVAIKAPAENALVQLGEKTKFEITLGDDKDKTLAVKVTSATAPKPHFEGDLAVGDATLDASDLPAGLQKITVTVTDSAKQTATASVTVLVNTAPTAPGVAIQPEKPTTADELVASVVKDADDPDRKPSELKYSYSWLKDGQATSFTGNKLPAFTAKKGEKWTVQVVANDPIGKGPAGAAEVVIQNAAPTAAELAIAPTAVDLATTVTCTLAKDATDVDGDALTYGYEWRVNGAALAGETAGTLDLKTQKVKVGDEVACAATASDGTVSGTQAVSAGVKVGAFDVCSSSLNPCALSANCTNTDSLEPQCGCKDGYKGDGKSCDDVDECADKTAACDPNSACANTVGGYTCTCNKGWSGDGKACADVDECAEKTADCDANADCQNKDGGFTCFCKKGYKGEDGKNCTDIDECADGSAGCDANATCENKVGSFACTCKTGYAGDGTTCADIDECADGSAGCDANAKCDNTVGGVTCTCNPGFTGDGKTCADVDECASGAAGCSANATCANTAGSFTCTCNTGYIGDGATCVDIDECANGTAGCDANADCVNSAGGFKCTCKAFWEGDGKACTDIDECKTNNGGCGAAEAYSCKNNAGAAPTCDDIDECATGTAKCDAKATCANTKGGYTCTCASGYKGDGKTCTDIDECASGVPFAQDMLAAEFAVTGSSDTVLWQVVGTGLYYGDAKAKNFDTAGIANKGTATSAPLAIVQANKTLSFDGTFAIESQLPFDVFTIEVLTGGSATVVFDKTKLGCGGVGTAVCTTSAKNYTVDLTAFVGKIVQIRFTFDTVDVDFNTTAGITLDKIKLTGTGSVCDVNAKCANSAGSFTCACNSGFVGDGKTCGDVNECLTNNGGCAADATCTNQPGSFACACKAGYAGDGKTCADVNECTAGTAGCDVNATCANTVGGFTCTCKTGFAGDGKTCAATSLCSAVGPCAADANCVVVNNVPACVCKKGYVGTGKVCADINECLLNNGGCSVNANCTNTPGSSTCACKTGFAGDGKTCVDVNECLVNNGGCNANATCTNGIGTFTCACKAGFTGDGKTCTDVNECLTNNGGCNANAVCTNTPGGNTCACKAGFTGDGKTCTDVNECATNNGGCAAGTATCTNSPGSFSCACNAGYTGDGKTCADIDECKTNNGGCAATATCTNSAGSFSCACNKGYTGDGKTCTDIDECKVGQPATAPVSLTGWTTNGTSTTVKWQVVGSTLYYGNPTAKNYATGTSANSGTITSPAIAITAANKTMSFDLVLDTEAGLTYDLLTLDVLVGGASVLKVDKNTFAAGAVAKPYSVDLTNQIGKSVQFRFTFNTVDGVSNGTTGVTVSNLKFAGTVAACDANATCTNAPATWSCACKAGFSGDGKTCADIDECKVGATRTADFTTDLSGFAISGNSLAVRWQNNGGKLYYGNPATKNFDSGAANNGTATSPAVLLTGAATGNVVTFDGTFDIEGGVDYDKLTVYVLSGAAKDVLAAKTAFTTGATPKSYSFSLDKYAGKSIRLQFAFDTVDGGFNGTTGITIDKLTVKTVSPCDGNATCGNTPGSFTCACNTGFSGAGKICRTVNTATFNANGGVAQPWTVPMFVTAMSVSVKGGGGGGGGYDTGAGAAGGAGGLVTANNMSVKEGTLYNIIAGNAGAVGATSVTGTGGGAGGALGGGKGGNAGTAGSSGGGGGGGGLSGLFLGAVSQANVVLVAGGGGGGGGAGNQTPKTQAAATPGGSLAAGAWASGGAGTAITACNDGGGGGGGGAGYQSGLGGKGGNTCDTGGFSGGGGSNFIKTGVAATSQAGGGGAGGGSQANGTNGSVTITWIQ